MIQRLLRGRFLYLVLGALLVASYVSVWTRSLHHPAVPDRIVRAPTTDLRAVRGEPRGHPPSPEAPPLGSPLRSRRFEARSAEKGFRPIPRRTASGSWSRDPEPKRGTGVPEGATGLPVGLHAAEGQPLEWWPTGLTLVTLRQLTVRAPLLMAALWILTLCAVGLAIAGVALSVWAVWTGRIRSVWRFASPRLPAWSFGELGRITLLMLIMTGFLPLVRQPSLSRWMGGEVDAHLRLTASMLFLDVFAILTIVAFAQGKGTSMWRALGLSSRKWAASMAVGSRSYVAVFPWMFLLLFVVVEWTRAMGFTPPIEPIQELIFQDDRPVVLGLTALLACVVGPVAEEFFFRGVIYTAIRRRTSWLVAMFASSALFALMHANLVGFPSLFMLGCLLGYLYERTGTLAGSLAVHVAHNTLLLSIALVLRQLTVVG